MNRIAGCVLLFLLVVGLSGCGDIRRPENRPEIGLPGSERTVVKVDSRKEWVPTSVWVQAGDRVAFHASGIWIDAFIPCHADGYPAPWLYNWNRPPRIPDNGRYFRLMGRIVPDGLQPREDDPAETFVIGNESERTADHAGRLFVFANDREGYYWNNFGSVTLTIEKVSGQQ
jgi:hypothetical protein